MNLLETIILACDDLKAQNIEVLDMRNISPLVDFMVICTGRSDRQVSSIVKKIKDELASKEMKIKHIEGADASLWVLIDCFDVIVHVFQNDERIKYGLERIWGDVPRYNIDHIIKGS